MVVQPASVSSHWVWWEYFCDPPCLASVTLPASKYLPSFLFSESQISGLCDQHPCTVTLPNISKYLPFFSSLNNGQYHKYLGSTGLCDPQHPSFLFSVTIRNISVPETAMNILAIPNGTSKNPVVLLALLLSSYHRASFAECQLKDLRLAKVSLEISGGW